MQSEILQRLEKAQQVAHSAGTLALDYFAKRDKLIVSSKGLQDRVTQADREVERHIFQEITEAFPGDGFLGEEMASGEPVKLVEEGTWVDCSDGESRAEVASSKMRMQGFFSRARAIATRCFSPPESFRPRSPTSVS